MCFTLLIEMTASLCVGRDDPARQTTSETHPHPPLRGTFSPWGRRLFVRSGPLTFPFPGGRFYSYRALILALMSLMTSEISGVVFLSFSMRSME